MFIDLHMHEMTYSKDSYLKLDEIVKIAKMRGLQGICITDHDSMGLKEYAKEYSKERVDAQTFIDEVNRQGGVCFSAHPS